MNARNVITWVEAHSVPAAVIAVSVFGLLVVAYFVADRTVRRIWRGWSRGPHIQSAPGARGFYVAAALGTAVSASTSYRFFGERLHITDTLERVLLFAVLEVAFVACAVAMRATIRQHGTPGPARAVVWGLTAIAAYVAWDLSGFLEGLARVTLGPVLAVVMLHLGLGLDLRASRGVRSGTLTRVLSELRERLLSRLGLSDDARDAAARTRDRAARRAARLALSSRVPFRSARLARALRACDAAHDAAVRGRMLSELAVVRHADQLATLEQPSPWVPAPIAVDTTSVVADAVPVTAATTAVSPDWLPSGDDTAQTAPDTERTHRAVLDAMPGPSDRIRYAASVTGSTDETALIAWCAERGHEVKLSAARSSVRRMRARREREGTANVVPFARAE